VAREVDSVPDLEGEEEVVEELLAAGAEEALFGGEESLYLTVPD
jgi:hypothetical protein